MSDPVAVPVDDRDLALARKRMGAGLVSMGVLHVVAPEPFHKIIPDRLPNPRLWNLVAAGAELAAGALLLTRDPRLRRAGGWLALGTIVGVYPANIDMARKAGAPTNPKAIAAWARLPMQFPMIRTAYRLARAEDGPVRG
jgi:uncharacterized membrane protein